MPHIIQALFRRAPGRRKHGPLAEGFLNQRTVLSIPCYLYRAIYTVLSAQRILARPQKQQRQRREQEKAL